MEYGLNVLRGFSTNDERSIGEKRLRCGTFCMSEDLLTPLSFLAPRRRFLALVLALRALQSQLAAAAYGAAGADPRSGDEAAPLNDLIPEAPETLQRAGRVIALLAGGISTDEKSVAAYVEKYQPFARKMLAEQRFRDFGR